VFVRNIMHRVISSVACYLAYCATEWMHKGGRLSCESFDARRVSFSELAWHYADTILRSKACTKTTLQFRVKSEMLETLNLYNLECAISFVVLKCTVDNYSCRFCNVNWKRISSS